MMTTTASERMAADNPAARADQQTQKKKYSVRVQIARQILFYHVALIAISFLFFILKGFDGEEFTSLMGMLGPVTAIYAGAVYRFLGRSITEPAPIHDKSEALPITNMVRVLVHGHFITMLALISIKAIAPNVINFQEMTLGLTLVESAIGVYMGSVLLALFEGKTKD